MALAFLDAPPEPHWPAPLQQHPVFAAALVQLGVAHRTLGWDDARGPGSVLLMHRRLGPFTFEVASRAHLTEEIAGDLRHSRLSGRGFLALTPENPLQPRGWLPVVTPAHVAEWDLTGRIGAREAALSGPWRTALRKARKADLEVVRRDPSPAELAVLFSRDAEGQGKKGYRALPMSLVLALQAANPDAVTLYRAQCGGEGVAEALVLKHRPAATYHIGWSSEAGRATQAMNLTLWEAASDLARDGFERFDLGLVATDRAPGLARFKIGTGARVRPLGPTLLCGPFTQAFARWAARSRP